MYPGKAKEGFTHVTKSENHKGAGNTPINKRRTGWMLRYTTYDRVHAGHAALPS